VQTAAEMLSKSVIRLDRASGHLDQLNQAVREGESANADGFLEDYVDELTSLRKELGPLFIRQEDFGLIGAVMDRLDSQLARLENMKGNVLAGHSASVEEPLSQLKALFLLVQTKVTDSIP
jgi:hypothetical protein